MGQAPLPWISVSDEVTRQAEAEWVTAQPGSTRSWREAALLAIPLVYLIYVAVSVRQNSHGASAVTGYALLAAFAACWLVTPFALPERTSRLRF